MSLTKATVREPGSDFLKALSSSSRLPDPVKALEQHRAYAAALGSCGLEVTVLEPLEGSPDCPFVEDVAVFVGQELFATRPGAYSRRNEVLSVIESFQAASVTYQIAGSLEGGDVLRVKDHFYIGQSERSSQEGILELGSLITKQGLTWSLVPVKSSLHLKTAVTWTGKELVGWPELRPYFKEPFLEVTEPLAANLLAINGKLICTKSGPIVINELKRRGHSPIVLDISEFEAADGGLTCLSLLS